MSPSPRRRTRSRWLAVASGSSRSAPAARGWSRWQRVRRMRWLLRSRPGWFRPGVRVALRPRSRAASSTGCRRAGATRRRGRGRRGTRAGRRARRPEGVRRSPSRLSSNAHFHAGLADVGDVAVVADRARQGAHGRGGGVVAGQDVVACEDVQAGQGGGAGQRVAGIAVGVQEGALARVVEEGVVEVAGWRARRPGAGSPRSGPWTGTAGRA